MKVNKTIVFGLFFVFICLFSKAQISCNNNWLKNINISAGVQIGDLDVPGNTITVEALINSTYSNPGGRLYAGDIVSKHHDAYTCNYLLRPNSAEITTTNGYYITPQICDIVLNKTYHVAMVYDGSFLKFYRNGFLMSKVAASGNLIQNNYLTMIGEFAGFPSSTPPEEFVGFIDEVRIWNIARTQNEIRSNMNNSISNPINTVGLLAYYSFGTLKNLQGNSNWDAVIIGNAQIQMNNPNCNNFTIDSCEQVQNPILIKSNDTTICLGKFASLFANTSNASSISWNPQTGLSNPTSFNPLASPSTSTKYYFNITAKNNFGVNVTLKDSILVQVIQKPKFEINPVTSAICQNDSIQLTASGGDIYQWKPSPDITNINQASIWIKPINNSVYTVQVTENTCGFTETLQSDISIKNLPQISISKSNDIDCSNNTASLIATGGNSYLWQPANGLSNSQIANPITNINQTTTFKVNVTASNGCTASDSITVLVTNTNLASYFIPNSFTPNNDGLNDTFGIKNWGVISNFSFSIFNRWGQLIFYTNNPSKHWDGKLNEILQDMGTYIYLIKAETFCGHIEKKGTFLLIR